MGSATRYKQKFLRDHPTCAFCGGHVKATTIEHCPPRAMFRDRQWPEGFEFPSCEACNNGTSNHDLLIALLARFDPFENSGISDNSLNNLMKMANKQYPGLFGKMRMSPAEARHSNRIHGLQPMQGQAHQETGIVKIPQEWHEAVYVLARKLVKGIFYREVKLFFPNDGCLVLNWFTNSELIRSGRYEMFDLLKELGGNVPTLQRSGQYLNDQFEYKLSFSNENELIVLQVKFGSSFGFVVFGSPVKGLLEEGLLPLIKTNSTFHVLQSPQIF